MAVGLEYLKNRLSIKSGRVEARYRFYEMKNRVKDMSLVDNLGVRLISPTLGWCAKAVDSLADRLSFKGWSNDNFNLQYIFDLNNPDIFFDNAILNALITSCSFVYVSEDTETGMPRLEVLSGSEATGVLDPVTNLLEEGYAILERDKYGNPSLEAYFLPGMTIFFPKDEDPYEIQNKCPYPLLVPVIYRPDSRRPFGHSRISRAMMSLVEGAVRTVKRSEVSAEFYSFPQKYMLGTSYGPDEEPMDKWKATISTFLEISKDEDGDKPVVGQFSQQSMQPYLDQIRGFASLFAGETGLTLDDLGFVSENPSSAEAIKASHESLKVTASKAQRVFGSCFLNVGYVAACLRDNFPYNRNQFFLTKPLWNPAFEPDASTLSVIGDGAVKINQAIPGYFNKDNLEILTGIKPSDLPVPETAESAAPQTPETETPESTEQEEAVNG